jgi:hypothetical protein
MSMKKETIIRLVDPIQYNGVNQACCLCSKLSLGTKDDLFFLFLTECAVFKGGFRHTFYCHHCVSVFFEKHIIYIEKIDNEKSMDIKSELCKLWESKRTDINYKIEVLK